MTAIDPATAAAVGTKVVFALLRGLFSGIFLAAGARQANGNEDIAKLLVSHGGKELRP